MRMVATTACLIGLCFVSTGAALAQAGPSPRTSPTEPCVTIPGQVEIPNVPNSGSRRTPLEAVDTPPEETGIPNTSMPSTQRVPQRLGPRGQVVDVVGRYCYSDATKKGDAQQECKAALQCTALPPCTYDKNRQLWRCTC